MPAEQRRSTWEYYDRRVRQGVPGVQRAVEYWSGLGVQVTGEDVEREAAQIRSLLGALPDTTFVEAAAGPGTFTGFLSGRGVALDQSPAALARLVADHPESLWSEATSLHCLFEIRAFARYFAAHIFGLLQREDARGLLREAARVADEILILDAGRPIGVAAEEWQDRTLPDGGRYRIYRRHFEPDVLGSELGGSVLFGGSFYVLVRVTAR